ncbi:DinB family protein [Fictibacillus phosphorivorans]|uniref:DinB family protein n=1 Tax=Fictibacillus phosphorivorans TaxID=1221500 RepID=UPI00203EB076|nr:DinB family protein [Fictibacillus phosphorivorans]MCM3719026.1 DinB family protein [Fictibacillus phosphorivorans]MCM3776648.1 DinB family protein [Fictibacillus phosphorivorans]
MHFKINEAIELLERTPKTLSSLLTGLSPEWLTCSEGEDTWNTIEVVAHLIEGEKVNWFPRMNMILTQGDDYTFPSFDRFAHLTRNETNIEQLLLEFKHCREESLDKLRNQLKGLKDFEQTARHPEFGPVRLRELLSTWVVHDLTHLSQITRVMAKRYKDDVGPWKNYLGILR